MYEGPLTTEAATEHYRGILYVGIGDSYERAIDSAWELAEKHKGKESGPHKIEVLQVQIQVSSPGKYVIPCFINH